MSVLRRNSSASVASPPPQVRVLEQLRAQPEDEVADVADRAVDAVDGPVDAGLRLGGSSVHQLADVLERQADRVQRLDDAVVQVLADALALLEHRQLPQLLVQARVVDGDARRGARTSRPAAGRPR